MYISDSLFSCYMCSTAAESRSVRRDRNFRLARTSIATESRSVRQELARTSTATESKRVRPKLPRASDLPLRRRDVVRRRNR